MFDKWKMKRRMSEVQKLEKEVSKLKGGPAKKASDTPVKKDDLGIAVEGKYITKDLRFRWVYLILIAILIIAGLTVFSQWKFKDINNAFNEKVSELEKTYTNLKDKESRLNATSEELLLKTEREETLASEYEQMRKQKEALQAERDELQRKNTNLETQVDQANAEIDRLEMEVQRLEERIEELEGN
ncbi:MAG TPA: hypothetical protein VJC07_01475 [Candidatus Nanoarchaeia archaeon]|nr:hypothetical protein [Candidatus Nanoarchaeia archaeon]